MSDKNLQTATEVFLKLMKAHPSASTAASLVEFASPKIKKLIGNLNKEEKNQINKSLKDEKLKDIENKTAKKETKRSIGPAGASIVSEDGKKIKTANLAKGGFPDLSGDGEVTQKDILMGKGVIKMKKGGIVKKKSSRTRIAKRGFGIAKRGY